MPGKLRNGGTTEPKLTAAQKKDMFKRFCSGDSTAKELAAEYNVSPSSVYKVLYSARYRDAYKLRCEQERDLAKLKLQMVQNEMIDRLLEVARMPLNGKGVYAVINAANSLLDRAGVKAEEQEQSINIQLDGGIGLNIGMPTSAGDIEGAKTPPIKLPEDVDGYDDAAGSSPAPSALPEPDDIPESEKYNVFEYGYARDEYIELD